jgi:peptide deformylase
MIREIVKDPLFLQRKAEKYQKADINTARDLCDTLRAHHDGCVGMAANMIGINQAVIAVDTGKMILVLCNPVILQKNRPYETKEGCLSLEGTRNTTRYDQIKVKYQDLDLKDHTGVFQGFTAEIIQHEVDHLNGRLI